jgi:hypothetical protein
MLSTSTGLDRKDTKVIAFYCSCGWKTTEPRAAFLHRSETHIIRPLTEDEARSKNLTVPFSGTGIEKFFLEEEICQSTGNIPKN